jgi:nucleoside-diphosphate-sugar epimerase
MKGECIIITGSSGLIGSALIDRLGERFQEFAFDRKGPPHPPPVTEHVIDCDLSSDESVQEALDQTRSLGGPRIASVIHLAAHYDFSGEPSPLYEQITIRGTERLLRGLRDFEVGQFVFASTMLVHAPCQPGQRINEDWPIEPKWDYPKSKVATEKLIHEQHGKIPAVILRIAGVYDDHCHSIPLAHQMQRIYERKLTSHYFPGEGSHGQSFLHLEDLLDALERTIERRQQLPAETVLLLGEAETLGYEELQREFGRLLLGEPLETKIIPKALAKSGAWLQDKMLPGEEPFIKPWMIDLADDHFALDITRAGELLGWKPAHSLRTTLPAMAGLLKSDPLRWYKENKLEVPKAVEKGAATAGKGE